MFASLGVPGVALGVFYALYKGLGFTFAPVSQQWVGPIVVLFLLMVGGVTFFALHRYGPDRKQPQRLDDVLSLYETLRTGLASPIQNVEQIQRIANSTDPNRERYLREFSNVQSASFLEVEAVRDALKALERDERVQDLFPRVSSAEKERIVAMIPATDDPLFRPIMVGLKYWRYINRKTHPAYDKVNQLLAGLLARRAFTPEELALSKQIVSEEKGRLGA